MMASCHEGLLFSCVAFLSVRVLQVYVCSSCCATTHAWLYVILSIVYLQMEHIGQHNRERNGRFTDFVAAESFSSLTATLLVNDFREERPHWL